MTDENTIYLATSKIGVITGNFISNTASGVNAYGGAIYNYANSTYDFSTIESIAGDFTGNSVIATSGEASGGAIYNSGTNAEIDNITGNFTSNYAISTGTTTSTNAYGGAIWNSGTITNIEGNFDTNYASAYSYNYSYAYGGAIYNSGTITSIDGSFSNNTVTTTAESGTNYAYGGAIYLGATGVITSIGTEIDQNTFDNNSATSTHKASGGAIYIASGGEITNIYADFTKNNVTSSAYSTGTSPLASGGAIYNSGTIDRLIGDFESNSATNTSTQSDENSTSIASGGAIYNTGTIGNTNDETEYAISGSFINNYATSANSYAYGGAIYNYSNGKISMISAEFENNFVSATEAYGGAIYNIGTIGVTSEEDAIAISGIFTANYAQATSSEAYGGAIFNYLTGIIGNISASFSNNYAQSTESKARGGAIFNDAGTIGDIKGNFTYNYATSIANSAYGGAIYNSGTISYISGNFINNFVQSTASVARGGAIFNSSGTIYFLADGADTSYEFTNNYTISNSDGLNYNAIYSTGGTLNFVMSSGGSFKMNDSILGSSAYTVAISGESAETETFYLNDEIDKYGTVTVTDATLELGSYTHERAIDADNNEIAGSDITTYGSIEGGLELDVNSILNIDGGSVALSIDSKNTILGDINLIAGSFTFNNYYDTISSAFTWSGGDIFVTNSTKTLTIADGGTLFVDATPEDTQLTLSNLTVNENASLTITSGILYVSDTLTVDANATDFSTSGSGTLMVGLDDFGYTLNVDGSLTDNSDATILKTLTNDYKLILTGISEYFTEMTYTAYRAFLDSETFATSTGLIELLGVTILDAPKSLDELQGGDVITGTVMAGTLDLTDYSNKVASAYGIVVNDTASTTVTDSTIKSGSTLYLTGEDSTALLDEGSLTNEGTLYLGDNSVESASFGGQLTNSGTTTVLSDVTFSEEVVNNNSMEFATSVTFEDTFSNMSGATATFTGDNTNGESIVVAGHIINQGALIFESDVIFSSDNSYEKLVMDVATASITFKGDATIAGNNITDGTLTFEKDATFNDKLILASSTTANFTGEDSTITGDITSNGKLNFNENTTLTGALEIQNAGEATFSGETEITGAVVSTGKLLFESTATLGDSLTVSDGSLIFESSATLEGNLQVDDGSVTFNDTAALKDITTISDGDLTFEDVATLEEISISNDAILNFNGNTTINKAFKVSGGTTTFSGATNSVTDKTTVSSNGIINISTGSTLTLASLDLSIGDDAEINVSGTLNVSDSTSTNTQTITWGDNNNQIIVAEGGTFITNTSNIYTYDDQNDTLNLASDLSNSNLTFVGVSTLSFSGVTSITMEEYDAVKNALYNISTGFDKENDSNFLINFGDAIISDLVANKVVNTGTENTTLTSNETEIYYDNTYLVAEVDSSKMNVDDNNDTNVTVTAYDSGSLGGISFTDVNENAETLTYSIGDKNITLGGTNTEGATEDALVSASNADGTPVTTTVQVGTSGSLTLGTENTTVEKTGTLENVDLLGSDSNGATLNVTGSESAASSFTITGTASIGENASVNVSNNSTLTVAEIETTGENATVSVSNNSALIVTGATTLAYNASVNVSDNATLNLGSTTLGDSSSISVVGNSTTVIDSITVASGATSAPYIYADPSYVAVKKITGKAGTANQLDFSIYVGEGSSISLGTESDILEANNQSELKLLFDEMGYSLNILDTGGFIPSDSAQTLLYLALGGTLTLGDGDIVVDDSVTDSSNGQTAGTITLSDGSICNPSGLYLGADSYFVADLSGFSEDTAVIDGSSKNLYVDTTSTLGIVGASAGTYTILTNFTVSTSNGEDSGTASDIWGDGDIYVGNSLQEITGFTGDGTTETPFKITIATVASSSLYDGPVGDIIYNAANYQDGAGFSSSSDNAGVRFVYNVASNIDNEKQERVIEGAAQHSATSGTNANTYQANRASVNIQQGRYHLYDATLLGSQSLGDSGGNSGLNVVTRNADGSIKEEFSGVTQVASSASLDNLYNSNNSVALWFMPFYGHNDVSGMEAGSYTSDYKTDIYGVAVGVDKTFTQVGVADAVRVGLAFNMGYGETLTSGDFENVETDFDFYGISAYGAAQFGKLTLSADMGYTKNNSEINQNLSSYNMENLVSDVDSEMWHFGVRGEYTHILENHVKIIPHLGLDLLTMKTNNYNVKENSVQGGTIFTVESDRQNVLSVPIGLTVTKHFDLESGWNMAPKARLGAIFAMGDLNEESTTIMPGIDGIANMSMEVVDPATLDLGLGVSAKYDNFRLALDYNLQLSNNRTAHGVMGILEYKF